MQINTHILYIRAAFTYIEWHTSIPVKHIPAFVTKQGAVLAKLNSASKYGQSPLSTEEATATPNKYK
jgi:hypothetical protein